MDRNNDLIQIRDTYRQFLETNFKGLILRKPLFYNWPVGLRFDLQTTPYYTDDYFREVNRRAIRLFESAFDLNDPILLVLIEFSEKGHKIRNGNFVFQQIENLNRKEIYFTKAKELYYPNDKEDVYNIAVIPTSIKQIKYHSILSAIANANHPLRRPKLDNSKCLPSKEVYFLNLHKKLIFHMYDDRGLDIIGADKENIQSLFIKHNEWILEHDRIQIEQQFK